MEQSVGFKLCKMLGVLALLGAAQLAQAEGVKHTVNGNNEFWEITAPIVNTPDPQYFPEIFLYPGDVVVIDAGGCVQTGGKGLTWKRYVDPQGPNSTLLYHGSITIPGFISAPLREILAPISPGSDHWRGTFTLPVASAWPSLSYTDDGYSDNGYYSHDDGTGNQCKDVGNAYIAFTITHQ